MRLGLKSIALVFILGIAAYLLFIPKSTEPQRVSARQQGPQPAHELSSPSVAVPQRDAPSQETDPKLAATVPVDTRPLVSGLPAALDKASPLQRHTADRLLSFIATGRMSDIRDLTPEEVRSLAEFLTNELGPEPVANALESHFGFPADDSLARGNVAGAVTDLFEAVQAKTDSSTAHPLVFTDQVQPDGSVTGHVHVIPARTKRVYAVFENTGGLQGLDHVLAVWRNPSDDRMVFTEYEPVRAGAVYNYVWLELDDGWPSGFYQVDLFHPSHTTQLLASRSFSVR